MSANLIVAVSKLFPNTLDWYKKKVLDVDLAEKMAETYPRMTVDAREREFGVSYTVKTRGHTAFSCMISSVFAFCGAKQMHYFSYSALEENEVHAMLDAVAKDYDYFSNTSNRLLVGVVEYYRRDSGGNNCFPVNGVDDGVQYQYEDIPEIENPNMEYPFIYSWCKKQKKCTTTRLMWNANTCNILHLLEVVL